MKKSIIKLNILTVAAVVIGCTNFCGCGEGYSNQWLYPQNVSNVYVEMFDSRSFRRGFEYVVTDAVCKRIEAETPYKIVSDRDLADTILTGQIDAITSSVLAGERYTGRPLENEAGIKISLAWKNLKTGELLINNETVTATGTFSTQLGQDFDYAANIAANRAAEKVVELMQQK